MPLTDTGEELGSVTVRLVVSYILIPRRNIIPCFVRISLFAQAFYMRHESNAVCFSCSARQEICNLSLKL